MRLLAHATALALCALLCAPATAASATTRAQVSTAVVYGYAWADGAGALRLTPRAATYRRPLHRFTALAGARPLRLSYTGAAYRRVTVACDLKETEGEVAIDGKGRGTTRCTTDDLADSLKRGPVPVRVEHRDGRAVTVTEVLAQPSPSRVERGTLRWAGDSAVLFTRAGRTVRLGHTGAVSFSRVTRGCGDKWLAGSPVNAGRDGLGRKPCTAADLARALKGAGHAVAVQVDYVPVTEEVQQVWEVYGDA
ncbi:hypothetical protein GCM10010149_30960 [Nonomuraea roseoviolacea subsp. roseoviolacea]|uniref:META domain-containing protein n=1 Tax=Nonomuraea roseoviolacea subsp. carminata TaxID=160689 RepID=A0ABT1K313_9ACTN|nr:hypothetical protein [Nonomuraea roseoviolacea]MCP2348375.1 hypothetical protein [Nonomuraea roseoviolacea subsp. carminata]